MLLFRYCLVPKFCLTLCNPVDCSMPGSPDRYCLPVYAQTMSIELMTPSNHLDLSHSLLFLPSIFPSIRVFSSESTVCIRWPKYWSLNLSISPSNIVIHNFIRLYSIYSHYKILAIFLLLYNISFQLILYFLPINSLPLYCPSPIPSSHW